MYIYYKNVYITIEYMLQYYFVYYNITHAFHLKHLKFIWNDTDFEYIN